MSDSRHLVNSTQYNNVSCAILVCSAFGWRYSGDTFQRYGNWDGNTVLGLYSQQCHQTREKVSKHQLAAKGKCTDCRGEEIPQKNSCPRLGRAKQRNTRKSSPACCFLVHTESRQTADLYQKHWTLAVVIREDWVTLSCWQSDLADVSELLHSLNHSHHLCRSACPGPTAQDHTPRLCALWFAALPLPKLSGLKHTPLVFLESLFTVVLEHSLPQSL